MVCEDCGSCLLECISYVSCLNFALYFEFLGLDLNRYPQQGHHNPSHSMNNSHIWHLLWPDAYRPHSHDGFWALYLVHIPLQAIQTAFVLSIISQNELLIFGKYPIGIRPPLMITFEHFQNGNYYLVSLMIYSWLSVTNAAPLLILTWI